MPIDPLYLNPGDLRHRVTILKPSTQRDAAGQPSQTWTPVLVTRASIRGLTARELASLDVIASQNVYEIRIRYPGNGLRLVSGMRVQALDGLYLVQDVTDELARRRVVKITALAINEDA
jgi:SPP1 family predicted phage head-tail adaptor